MGTANSDSESGGNRKDQPILHFKSWEIVLFVKVSTEKTAALLAPLIAILSLFFDFKETWDHLALKTLSKVT